MKNFLFIYLVFCSLYLLWAADPQIKLTNEEQNWLMSHASELSIATESNYPPLTFETAGEWRGISADVIHLVEQRLGVKFSLLPPNTLDSILDNAQKGKVGIVTSVKETPERAKYLTFTESYISIPTVVIINKDLPIGKWPNDFFAKKIAVSRGYSVQTYLEKQFPQMQLILTKDDLEGLRKLSFGSVDAVVMDIASATYFIEHDKILNLRISENFNYAYDLSFGVRKDLPLLSSILSKALKDITENEKQNILHKWVHLEIDTIHYIWEKYWISILIFLFLIVIGVSFSIVTHIKNKSIKEANQKNNELLIRLQKLASMVPGTVYQFLLRPDGSSCFPFSSEAIYDIYRVRPEEVLTDATKVFEIIHPDDYEGIVQSIQKSALELSIWSYEYRVIFKDGTVNWLMGHAQPEKLADGSVLWHGFITNINERKIIEAALIMAKETAESASLAKSTFLANMSHELRTPLNAILGFSQLLEMGDLSAQHKEYLQYISSSGKTLLSLISDILDLSKVEAQKIEIESLPLSIHKILEELIATQQLKINSEQVSLIKNISLEVAQSYLGDALRIRQILNNLVNNALKFTKDGEISITVKVLSKNADKDLLQFKIADTGIGMSPEALGIIFKPFVQANAGTTREYGGSGLGLAICKNLVELMGGQISVESTPLKGSTFTFEIPFKHQ